MSSEDRAAREMPVHRTAAAPLEIGPLMLLGILWGIPYALTKISLQTIPPMTLVAARVSLAAMALWIIIFASGGKFPERRDFAWRLFVQAVVSCVIPYTLVTFGQQSVASALAAILNSTTPIFVVLVGAFWTRHEPLTFGRLFGVTVGLGGVIIIAGVTALSGLGRETAGQAAIVVATFSSAVSAIHGRRFAGVAPEIVAAGMLTCAAVMLVPLCFLVEAPLSSVPSAAAVAALLVNAVVATAFGFVIYFRLIRTIGSMGTSSASYLKPAVGVLIGCALMGESLTWTLAAGLVAVLLGVWAINQKNSFSAFSRLASKIPSRGTT
jgi:drug/metabolite transporter (DMT)-like permease